MERSDIKKILVYRIGHLGDTLVAMPAFWSIRKEYPDAEMTLLTNVNEDNPNFVMAKAVLPETGLFDEVLTYVLREGIVDSIIEYLKLFLAIRKRNFDTAVYLTTRNRTLAQINRDKKFFRLAGIKKIVGVETLIKNRLEIPVNRPLPKIDSELKYLNKCVTDENFSKISEPDISLHLTDIEKETANHWLKKECGEAVLENRLFGVALSSKWKSKNWASDNYIRVIENMIAERNIFPVFFGGNDEREIGDDFVNLFNTGANAAGRLNIRTAAAALEKCRIFLGNDTGTMHLAASVKTPCIGVFAAIDWAGRWYPFGANNTVFREIVECEACLLPICNNNNKCLRLISPEKVFEACLRTWDKSN